jgi:pectinesterase
MIKTFLLHLLAVCISTAAFAARPDFIVAKDGTGNFTTVQEAINAVQDSSNKRTVIFIKNGTYKEKLTLPVTKINVSFMGEDVNKVILTYDDYASKQNGKGVNMGTTGSSSFFIYGDGFTAENITFENSAGPVGQAVAVRVSADRIQFKNCRFLGFQDTLYVHGAGAKSRQYYKNCYIEGTTDFIFGAATVLFENCTIYCKKGGSYITAANTPKEAAYGMVFFKCTITGENGVSYYLGRPWGDFAKTVFMQSKLPAFIKPEGWHNWGRPAAEQTVQYAEYKNTGEGAATGKRARWSSQLNKEEAKKYSAKNILSGWNTGK